MISFFTTSGFRLQLKSLLGIRKGVYRGVTEEISKEFKNKEIDEIRNNRDMILMQEDAIVIKLRLPDKKQRLSKRDGYRLIYLVSTKKENVVFLSVYPKNGPSQKLDITECELKDMLTQFISEARENLLEKFDII